MDMILPSWESITKGMILETMSITFQALNGNTIN